MATVIRVKRRKSDQPAEALLVVSKGRKTKSRHGATQELERIADTEEKIFHFATTVRTKSPMNDEVKEKVRNAILLQQKRQISEERSGHYSNEKKSLTSLKNKLKSMALNHHFLSEKKEQDDRQKQPSFRQSPTRTYTNSPSTVLRHTDSCHHHPSRRKMLWKPYYPIQVMMKKQPINEMPNHSGRCTDQKCQQIFAKPGTPGTIASEHVYDLYFCPKTNNWNVKDVIYVKPCKYVL